MSQSPTPSEAPGAGDTPSHGQPMPPEQMVVPEDEKHGAAIDPLPESSDENANPLVGAITEHSASLKMAVESLMKAVEALKPQPQSPGTDKKIAFWTAYKTLADEFDKEIQRKYGDDLDTSLIFAGLFSAVSSAFIIQIQPELQPDPNAPIEALLALLVQNITGHPLALLPPAVSTSQPTPLPNIVLIAQCLLYFSLFSTLLAALLAVLGKQWLLHYDSVGERGTIAERGVERQRKFDGMRRWRFDLVMQVFPLLLQFSLLLFAAALSIYLWTIHRALAAIALTLTGLGSIMYTAMIISAVVSPDSPFQTSLSFLLKAILDEFPFPPHWRRFVKGTRERLYRPLGDTGILVSQSWTACIGAITRMAPVLPMFNIPKSHDPVPSQPIPIFLFPGSPSKEVSAVVWALETSTDPGLVEIAADLVPELQWPVKRDTRSALKRLDDIFRSCIINTWNIRDGMTNRATACILAFWMLDMVTRETQRTPNLWTFDFIMIDNTSEALDSIQFWSRTPWDLDSTVPQITLWALRFIAAHNPPEDSVKTILRHFNPNDSALKDKSIFADFLFCLNSVFCDSVAQDHSVLDKR
ncbi:hypothetical protein B0H14DRAFT_3460678 [Mycena olivaceomarginata]|nr:hypothetical protein B0H14DRAFT_3460678 [Mycena olivaceomarginata]